MNEQTMQSIANSLYNAEMAHTKIEKLSVSHPGVTVDEAYRIQLKVLEKKLTDGQSLVGKKIGLTNLAMQKAIGITEPDYGNLLDGHMAMQDAPLSMSALIQPQIEAELAFVMARDVRGPGVTAGTIMAAAAGVMASFEIVDCRYTDMKISLADTVADNASCGKIILGSTLVPLTGLDLRTIGLVLEKNGQIIDTAASAAVLGSPAASVAWLVNKISAYGISLRAGDIVMSGSFTNVHPIAAGDSFMAHFGGVGCVKVSFTD
jgi:2-oxopent-4-enoate hydratase